MNKTKANELLAEALSHDEPTKTRKLYELVNGIFDDIGSCDECVYSVKVKMMDNSYLYECKNIQEFTEVGYKDVSKEGYCSDFERKQDD